MPEPKAPAPRRRDAVGTAPPPQQFPEIVTVDFPSPQDADGGFLGPPAKAMPAGPGAQGRGSSPRASETRAVCVCFPAATRRHTLRGSAPLARSPLGHSTAQGIAA